MDKRVFWWFSYSTVLQVGVRQGRGASRISPSVDSRGIVKKWIASLRPWAGWSLWPWNVVFFFLKEKSWGINSFFDRVIPVGLGKLQLFALCLLFLHKLNPFITDKSWKMSSCKRCNVGDYFLNALKLRYRRHKSIVNYCIFI